MTNSWEKFMDRETDEQRDKGDFIGPSVGQRPNNFEVFLHLYSCLLNFLSSRSFSTASPTIFLRSCSTLTTTKSRLKNIYLDCNYLPFFLDDQAIGIIYSVNFPSRYWIVGTNFFRTNLIVFSNIAYSLNHLLF